MSNARIPNVPEQWHGDPESFIRCLSDFAADVLELIAARCDAIQKFSGDGFGEADDNEADDCETAFNDGVVAATRLVMEMASLLKDTNRRPAEWSASDRSRLDGAGEGFLQRADPPL